MKSIALLIPLLTLLFANHTFEPSETCKSCHLTIYQEFTTTQHANASIFKDEIHAAVWKKHPKNKKLSSYSCAKCHTPASEKLEGLIGKHNGIVPDAKEPTELEGISCAYCHRIESIKHGRLMNVNVIATEEKRYFGTLKSSFESPFHRIKRDGAHFNSGNVCIGCHSHKQNKFGLNVCSTNIDNELEKSNCVSCHMPKVKGSVSTLNPTKEHTFHGFPGTHSHQSMLSQYVQFEIKPEGERFGVRIINHASHALSLHPMRLMELRVRVLHAGHYTTLPTQHLARVIGAEGKPKPPWLAKEEVKNTAIGGYEKRLIRYDYTLEAGDEVEVTMGYYLVNPKMLKGLGLEQSAVATKFHHFKTQTIKINKKES